MKFTFATILFLFLFLFNSYSQQIATFEELEKIDGVYYHKSTSEQFTGVVQDLTDNTNDYMRLRIENGIVHGFFEGFYDEERTVLKWKVQYVNGKKEGEYIHYFENGQTGFVANMKADNMHGIRRCYYDTGELMHIHHYKKGKEHGIIQTYYKSGQQIENVPYKNGLKHGRMKKYHENGNLKQKGKYKNDKVTGIVKHYYESGKLQLIQLYKKGELIR